MDLDQLLARARPAERAATLPGDGIVPGVHPADGVGERDVLRAAADGATVADVAHRLHLSEGTVRNHLSSAIGKTGARTRAEAVRSADEQGWL
jgi:two-component system, NarL family, response regulator DesR